MKKIAMTLLATAVAVPMMFADTAPKADSSAPAAKAKHHHKKSSKKAPAAAAVTAPVK